MNEDRAPLRSALFVDFDNVFIALRESSPRAAEVFTRSPSAWLDWLTRFDDGSCDVAAPESDRQTPSKPAPIRRRILTRNCYLNPTKDTKGFRAFFTGAGFRVVDCPSLTQQGKSSSDIHMVMDILDILTHPVRYDEVIVMSADADFTAVMLRLRSHDRRIVIVTSSPVAHAYRSACDMVVGAEEFTTQLLRLQGPAAVGGPKPDTDEAKFPSGAPLPADMAEFVACLIEASDGPVSHATIAHQFTKKYNRANTVDGQWFGYGSFSDVLRTLDLKLGDRELVVDFNTPGYVYDPARHTRPAPAPDMLADLDPDLAAFIVNVSSTTGYPKLSPTAYQTLFQQIYAEVEDSRKSEREFSLGRTATAVAQRCADIGDQISQRQVWFVLHGYELSGLWRGGPHADSAELLAKSTFDSALNRCVQMGIPETEENRALLERWLLRADP
jgi:NYN domain-containing protein